MNEAKPYRSVAEVIEDRARWTIAKLAKLVQRGRADGWIEGAPAATAGVDAEVVVAVIEARTVKSTHAVVPMQWLAGRLGLASQELDVLWLLASIELSPAAARLAQVFGSAEAPDLTIQILQQLIGITNARLDALYGLGLIEMSCDTRLPHHRRAVRVNDRVIELARGELELDRELRDVASVHARVIVEGIVAPAIVAGVMARPAPLVIAVGPDGAGRSTMLADAAGRAGHGTLRVRTRELSREPQQLKRQFRAIVREACLLDVIPLFENVDGDAEHPARAAIELELRSFVGPVMASAHASFRVASRPVVSEVIEKPDREARAACWRDSLGGAREAVVAVAATQYTLRPGAIVAAARNALAACGGEVSAIETSTIQAGVRAQLGDQIGSLATRVDWRQTWDDLVLPPDQFEQIIELVARVRHRGQVLDTWGFADKVGKGHGVAALFSGPPGTGKTMVAGLIAQELGLDLYQVDLSKITSKFIGETEKNLAALFDAAESGQAIILFDEADALFAKRSEVKSSNDRYANLEVNYLLQRVEAFTGISLLTTNHESAIDDAFRRRLALHVRFPMPDEPHREQLWRAMLPAKAPVLGEIEFARLAAEFEMSGGYIKNAVLRGAYLAADEGGAISTVHLWRSARAEYEAMGKVAYQRAA
jgi:hypothetical protein